MIRMRILHARGASWRQLAPRAATMFKCSTHECTQQTIEFDHRIIPNCYSIKRLVFRGRTTPVRENQEIWKRTVDDPSMRAVNKKQLPLVAVAICGGGMSNCIHLVYIGFKWVSILRSDGIESTLDLAHVQSSVRNGYSGDSSQGKESSRMWIQNHL